MAQTTDILLTAGDVAKRLRLSKYKIYELAKPHTRQGEVQRHPLPALRIGTAVRFRSGDIDAWLEALLKSEQ